MHRVRQIDLPKRGISHEFVGRDQGGVGIGAGEILVVKAGEIHSFTCVGPEHLVQMDVHVSDHFEQTFVA